MDGRRFREMRVVKRRHWWKFWQPRSRVVFGPFPPEHQNCRCVVQERRMTPEEMREDGP